MNNTKNTKKKNKKIYNIDFLSSESNGRNERRKQISYNLFELKNLQKVCNQEDK